MTRLIVKSAEKRHELPGNISFQRVTHKGTTRMVFAMPIDDLLAEICPHRKDSHDCSTNIVRGILSRGAGVELTFHFISSL